MQEPFDTPPELVVILGAGPGLGRAVAAAFSEHGDQVVLLARDAVRLETLAGEVDAAARIAVDATDERALRSAFSDIRSRYGDPTVLVHNPSVPYEAPPTRTPLPALMDGFALAAGSLLVAAQEVAQAMRAAGHGTILVTGSGSAATGSTWSASLAAQKSAVRNLALSLAAELGPDGIRVATITIDGMLGSPGFERERIAGEYVRLVTQRDENWNPEVTWPT